MNEKADGMTAEEGIVKLRQLVQLFTGLDPRAGQAVKPVRELTKEEIDEFFRGVDEESK